MQELRGGSALERQDAEIVGGGSAQMVAVVCCTHLIEAAIGVGYRSHLDDVLGEENDLGS